MKHRPPVVFQGTQAFWAFYFIILNNVITLNVPSKTKAKTSTLPSFYRLILPPHFPPLPTQYNHHPECLCFLKQLIYIYFQKVYFYISCFQLYKYYIVYIMSICFVHLMSYCIITGIYPHCCELVQFICFYCHNIQSSENNSLFTVLWMGIRVFNFLHLITATMNILIHFLLYICNISAHISLGSISQSELLGHMWMNVQLGDNAQLFSKLVIQICPLCITLKMFSKIPIFTVPPCFNSCQK